MKYTIINLRIKKRTVIIYEQYKVAGRQISIYTLAIMLQMIKQNFSWKDFQIML